MPLIGFEDTLGCLAIESKSAGIYTAPNIPMDYHRVFGGQLLAQAVAVASDSCEGKRVKSLHVSFPRAGDLREPIEFRVDALQDGRAFAQRWITGVQGEKLIFSASVSLAVDEEGPSHQRAMPDVGLPEAAPPRDLSMIPWETRVVEDVALEDRAVGPPVFRFWMRTPELPDDRSIHQALFAHATDLTLIGTELRPLADLSEADSPERIQTAVTTHTVWFHRPVRMDDWILIAQESPTIAGARGFGWGHAFSRSGELVASFAQESLLRPVA